MIPKIKNLIREKRALDIIIFYEENNKFRNQDLTLRVN